MIEKDIENEVEEWAISEGGKALKLVLFSERGWPDRTIFLPGGELLLPELKLPKKNKKYEQQRRTVAWLQSLGFRSDFCQSLEDVKRLLNDRRV